MTDLILPPEPGSGLARHTDPITAKKAIGPGGVSHLEDKFLYALYKRGELATIEVARFYDEGRDSYSPRAQPLIRKGLIAPAPKRFVPNASGNLRWFIAFRLTAKGRELFRHAASGGS